MGGNVCEVSLPVFARLVFSEPVWCLTNLEIPLKVGPVKYRLLDRWDRKGTLETGIGPWDQCISSSGCQR